MKTRAFAFPVKFGLATKKKKKMKKKKSRGGGNIIINSDPSSTSNNNNKSKSGIVIDGDLIVHEILTRLPVKSLLRFKSVCKLWYSTIGKNRNFIDLHLTRSKSRNPSLFIIPSEDPPVKPLPIILDGAQLLDTYPLDQLFMTADFNQEGTGGASINTITSSYNPSFDTFSNPVNGLICFVDTQDSHAARIYNISTQQRSPWIKYITKEGEEPLLGSKYQFGFDPTTNEHKLVCLRRFFSQNGTIYFRVVCDVLTLGEGVRGRDDNTQLNKWRRIDEVPPQSVENPSVYVNGSIYWSTSELNWGGENWKRENRPVFIVAFDVGSEKFRTIQVPDFILDQPREHWQGALSNEKIWTSGIDLLEVNGRVALQIKMNDYFVKLWIFNDEKIKNVTTTSQQKWTEMSIKLPFRWRKYRIVRLHSVLDKIILTTQLIERETHGKAKKKYFSFYSYNPKNNITEKFEISGIPTDMCSIKLFTKFDESLLSVPT